MPKAVKLTGIAIVLLVTVLFAGCTTAPDTSLPEEFSEEALFDAASTVVEQLNNRDYEALYANFTEEMQASVSAEELAAIWSPVYDNAGDYIKHVAALTAVHNEPGQPVYCTLLVTAEYTGAKVTFTLSFDSQYRTGGLYLK